jgi:hypothetical protein
MKALLALALLLLVCGCSLGTTVASQAGDYNLAVEQAANTQLLRNVLRARDQLPLHFTTVPQIRGSLSIGLGQPGIGLPIGALAANGLNLGFSGSSSPSFDVSALDTQEFTRGLLEPLEPDLFRYYLERGYSEQLLLLLMFNSVVDPASGRRVLNDPRCWFERPDCPAPLPARLIEAAFLTDGPNGRYEFHDYTALTPLGPPLTNAQATDAGLLATLGDGKLTLRPVAGGRFQLYRQEARLAACRRASPQQRMVAVLGLGRSGGRPQATEQCARDEVVLGDGAPAAGPGIQIQLRSVADIIRWLGLVLRVQQELQAVPGEAPPCLAFRPTPTVPGQAAREVCTFRLARPGEAVPTGVAFEIDYADMHWQVPRFAEAAPDGSRRGDYTTQVLALLTELVNLKKASSAIPSTRAVQILR